MEKQSAAFFDFDRTLLDRQTSRIIIRYLKEHPEVLEHKPVPVPYIIRLLLVNELYKRHLYSDMKMAVLLLRFFKGRRLAVFENIAGDLYHRHIKPHLAPNVLVCLEYHRRKGDLLVLISASARYSLEPAASDLGFHHLRCTELEVGPDGLLTGRSKGPVCIDIHKRDAALELVQERHIDLSTSSAYGDHHSDIPLLEIVGKPVAVEPTPPLKAFALARGWPILSYR
jgi:HAD superfamily hydrolase (TIGR01490 family)